MNKATYLDYNGLQHYWAGTKKYIDHSAGSSRVLSPSKEGWAKIMDITAKPFVFGAAGVISFVVQSILFGRVHIHIKPSGDLSGDTTSISAWGDIDRSVGNANLAANHEDIIGSDLIKLIKITPTKWEVWFYCMTGDDPSGNITPIDLNILELHYEERCYDVSIVNNLQIVSTPPVNPLYSADLTPTLITGNFNIGNTASTADIDNMMAL